MRMQCPRHEFEVVYVDVMNDVALLWTMNENENDENEDGKEFAWDL